MYIDQRTYFTLASKINVFTSTRLKNMQFSQKPRSLYSPVRGKGSALHCLLFEKDHFNDYFSVVDSLDEKVFNELASGKKFAAIDCQYGKTSKTFENLKQSFIRTNNLNEDDYVFILRSEYDEVAKAKAIIDSNKTPITKDDMASVTKSYDVVKKSKDAGFYLNDPNAMFEQTFLCDLDGHPITLEDAVMDNETPMLMIKPDVLVLSESQAKYMDLKRTDNPSIQVFSSTITRMGYPFQNAMYVHVLTKIFGIENPDIDVPAGGYIAVNDNECWVYDSLSHYRFNNAADELKVAIKNMRRALATGGIAKPKRRYEFI